VNGRSPIFHVWVVPEFGQTVPRSDDSYGLTDEFDLLEN
jgi:hypothetical protein